MEFDKKGEKYEPKECEDNKPGGAKHPGFTYKSYKKKEESQSTDAEENLPKPLKKVIIDY